MQTRQCQRMAFGDASCEVAGALSVRVEEGSKYCVLPSGSTCVGVSRTGGVWVDKPKKHSVMLSSLKTDTMSTSKESSSINSTSIGRESFVKTYN